MRTYSVFTRITALFAVVLMGGYLLVRPAMAADAVAMVTDLAGKAQVVDEGRKRPLALLDYLRLGAEVKLGKDARVTLVYFQNSTQYVIAGEGTVRVTPNKPEVSGGAKLTANEMRQGALVANARKETAQGALVMKTAPQPIQPLSPVDTRVLDAHPVFVWKSPKAKPPFHLTLTDANKQVVTQADVKAMRFGLPAGVTLADGARYTWRVEGRTSKGEALVGEASFEVATAVERDKVRQARPTPDAAFSERVTYAVILDGMGFRDDARQLWRQLAAERPKDIRLRVRANKEH
ncbi:MAG: hypothetical protein AAB294_01365 [Pseudomonadota bacterium]